MAQTAEEKKAKRRAYDKARRERIKAEAAAATEAPKAKKAPAKKKVVAKKAAPKKKSVNVDVIADFLKVGDSAKIKSKAKSTLGKMINAEVVKIYACNRTGKDYVRLKADGHTYHKLLSALAPAE